MKRRLSFWLPALLLVLCQTALLVHQADIDAHTAHGDNCSVCLLAHGLNSALPASPALTPAVAVSSVSLSDDQASRLCRAGGFYLTRAPPAQPYSIV
jgi:hypothetical protein